MVDCLSLRVGDGPVRVVGFGLVINQRVNQELLTHVFKEVLLPPPLKHAVGDHDVAQIPATGQDCGLVSALRQTSHLPEPELSFQKPNRLIMQQVLHPPAFQVSLSPDESPLGDLAAAPFAIGQDVKTQREDFRETTGAPAASVEDDRQASIGSDQIADFLQDRHQHPAQGGIGVGRDDEERISLGIIDPVVGGGRSDDPAAGQVGLRNRALSVIGADMPVDIKKTQDPSPFGDAAAGQFQAEFPAPLHRGKPGELAPQGFHLGHPIEPDDAPEVSGRMLLERLRPRDAQQGQQDRGDDRCP